MDTTRWLTIVTFSILQICQFQLVIAMETDIQVDCHSDPENMVIIINTDSSFSGQVYVSERYGDPSCTVWGRGNTSTFLKVPFKGCNTTQKNEGLFMNRVTVQQHRMIVSAGDGEYEVGCKMFRGDVRVGSDNHMEVTQPPRNISVSTVAFPAPEVLLRIYDFENDVFVDTVKLGQVVELEVTIRDGIMYKGRVSDCDAFSADGKRFPVVREYCPVDLSISDKVYVDDQSRTTGDYYLYIPFKVFRFLDGARVSFNCNVIICQDDCPAADCGDFMGMSYGRRKRSAAFPSSLMTMTVTNEVTVVDDDKRPPRSAEKLNRVSPEESSENSDKYISMSYLIAGVAVMGALFISLSVNIYLLVVVRRHTTNVPPNRSDTTRASTTRKRKNSIKKMKELSKEEEQEIVYPPMPLRSLARSQSFY